MYPHKSHTSLVTEANFSVKSNEGRTSSQVRECNKLQQAEVFVSHLEAVMHQPRGGWLRAG